MERRERERGKERKNISIKNEENSNMSALQPILTAIFLRKILGICKFIRHFLCVLCLVYRLTLLHLIRVNPFCLLRFPSELFLSSKAHKLIARSFSSRRTKNKKSLVECFSIIFRIFIVVRSSVNKNP